MNNPEIILISLLLFLLLIIKIQNSYSVESFDSCNRCTNCNDENKPVGRVNFNNFKSNPATVLKDNVTINLPNKKYNNSLHHDVYCDSCYQDDNGEWTNCHNCKKYEKTNKTEFQSRYLTAMNAINKIINARENGNITNYTYHNLINKWLKIYYDVTLLPKDKINQLICSSYLSMVDSAKDKTIFKDFIANTWTEKCSKYIPAILFGEVDNVVDMYDKKSIQDNDISDKNEIDYVLNNIIEPEEKQSNKRIVNITDFRKDFDNLFKEKISNIQLPSGLSIG